MKQRDGFSFNKIETEVKIFKILDCNKIVI